MTKKCYEKLDHLSNLIINPTPDCNLRCSYCYEDGWRPRGVPRVTTDETFHSIREGLDFCHIDEIHIDFIGGESLLPGVEYYERFEEIFDGINKSCFVQSNGTLLTDDFCNFFKENGYTVGITFDGVPDCHNTTRSNSFSQTLEGIAMAKDYGLLNIVSSIISNHYSSYVEDNFKLYASLALPMRFTPGTPHVTPQNFHRTMQKMAEMWMDTAMPFRWHKLEDVIDRINNKRWEDITQCCHTCMGSSLDIEWNGTVVTCAHHANEPFFKLGNINNDHIIDLLYHENRIDFFKRSVEYQTRCQTCEFKYICMGTCFSNAYSNKLDYDPYCGGGADMYKSILNRCGLTIEDYKQLVPPYMSMEK